MASDMSLDHKVAIKINNVSLGCSEFSVYIFLIIWTARKITYLLRTVKGVLSSKRNRNEILVSIDDGR